MFYYIRGAAVGKTKSLCAVHKFIYGNMVAQAKCFPAANKINQDCL